MERIEGKFVLEGVLRTLPEAFIGDPPTEAEHEVLRDVAARLTRLLIKYPQGKPVESPDTGT